MAFYWIRRGRSRLSSREPQRGRRSCRGSARRRCTGPTMEGCELRHGARLRKRTRSIFRVFARDRPSLDGPVEHRHPWPRAKRPRFLLLFFSSPSVTPVQFWRTLTTHRVAKQPNPSACVPVGTKVRSRHSPPFHKYWGIQPLLHHLTNLKMASIGYENYQKQNIALPKIATPEHGCPPHSPPRACDRRRNDTEKISMATCARMTLQLWERSYRFFFFCLQLEQA